MSESIRVLYVSGSTAGSSPPLAAHDGFDVVTVEGISAGQDRLSVAAPDCIVLAPEAIATADRPAIESLWSTAPRCPCLLAPPTVEPPVVGEGAATATAPGDDRTTSDPLMTLAARIRASVDASPAADDSDAEAVEPMAPDVESIEAEAVKTTSIVSNRDGHPSDTEPQMSVDSELQMGADSKPRTSTDTEPQPSADTEPQPSADSEPAYRSLVEDGLAISTVGIFVLDTEFSVVWLNEGIEEYFGVDRENIIGKDKRQLITDRLKDIFAEPDRFAETVCATYDDNTYIEQFNCHVVGDETRADRWLEHSSYPISDGPYAGGRIEHYVDITEQQAAREQLEQQNKRLAEFASIASHDLRNPLHVIGSSLELAEETGESEHFERAQRAVGRMEQLIDDLLVLAKQGDGVDTVERVGVDDVARECWAHLSTDEASLRIKTDRTVVADRSRLLQLLENLFTNSITHASSAVTITVGACDGGVFIADDGPGIPAGDRDSVFERGYTTTREGTGLGLYIVSEIAAAHGWEVVLADSDDSGVRIEITGVDRPRH